MREEKKVRRIDYGSYELRIREILKYGGIGLGIGVFTVWICYRSFYAAPLAGGIAWLYLRMQKHRLCEERRSQLNYHFKDFLAALHTSMLAGYALENAVRTATTELERLYGREDVLCRELRMMSHQMELQVPVEQLFRDFGRRSHVEDIKSFGDVLVIAKRTGGNMNHVLQSTWQNLSEKIDTKREIDAVIAARKYELRLMSVMPAGIVLYLRLTFDGFMDKLYGNTVGVLVMSICLGVYLAALWIGKRMTEIAV